MKVTVPPNTVKFTLPARSEVISGVQINTASHSMSVTLPSYDLDRPDLQSILAPPAISTRLYADASFWFDDIQSKALDPNSANLVKELYANVKVASGYVNGELWSNGVFIADASSPILPVLITGKTGITNDVRLRKGIRIPVGFNSTLGEDGHSVIIDPIAKEEYNFFQLSNLFGGWTCSDAGILPLGGDGILQYRGYNDWNSASASHIPIAYRPIWKSELEEFAATGKLKDPHCIGLAINRPKKYPACVFPAQTSDGWYTGADAILEGTRFRFPAGFAIDPAWPLLIQILVYIIRERGCVVLDKTQSGTAFYVQDPKQFGMDDLTMLRPYIGNYIQTNTGGGQWIQHYKMFGDAGNPGIFPWMSMQAIV